MPIRRRGRWRRVAVPCNNDCNLKIPTLDQVAVRLLDIILLTCVCVCVCVDILWRMSDSSVCVSFSVHLYTFICVWIIYNTRGLLWRRIILL